MQQSILLTASVVLWIAAGFCLPSALRGRRRRVFWFLVTFATTMTLQPHVIYYPVDGVLGGTNVTYFVFHAVAIVSVALLDALVQEAVSARGLTRRRRQASAILVVVIIALQAFLFFGGDWRVTDDISAAFTPDWGYTFYASTTWLAMAYFSVSVGFACLADLRKQPRTVTRASLGLVTVGCVGVLAYAVISLTSAVRSTASAGAFVSEGWPHTVLVLCLLIAPVSLAVGLGLTATGDALRGGRKSVRDRALLWRITPLWERLLAGAPELSIERRLSRADLLTVRHPGVYLYRRYVEVRDSLLLDPAQVISPSERRLIEDAEHQIRATPAGSATREPVTSSETREGAVNRG